jgi:hypothetical protein
MSDYDAALEGFITRLGDLIDKLRDAYRADDDMEVTDLLDDLVDEFSQVNDFISANRP